MLKQHFSSGSGALYLPLLGQLCLWVFPRRPLPATLMVCVCVSVCVCVCVRSSLWICRSSAEITAPPCKVSQPLPVKIQPLPVKIQRSTARCFESKFLLLMFVCLLHKSPPPPNYICLQWSSQFVSASNRVWGRPTQLSVSNEFPPTELMSLRTGRDES